MTEQLTRREFVQTTAAVLLGFGALTLQADKQKVVSQSKESDLEQWLLDTGRGRIDDDIYLSARQNFR